MSLSPTIAYSSNHGGTIWCLLLLQILGQTIASVLLTIQAWAFSPPNCTFSTLLNLQRLDRSYQQSDYAIMACRDDPLLIRPAGS